jgi:hypothetical protein
VYSRYPNEILQIPEIDIYLCYSLCTATYQHMHSGTSALGSPTDVIIVLCKENNYTDDMVMLPGQMESHLYVM